ncbi:hypothetical protein RFI_01247 [Reticulomyxa filosa]|uniref:Uncharacterized protein n=1 Tax=Reticulomyxa filosa TaxID=46433 RepID=X6PCI0_RETFI|nr:hypothetical protein RFI_01247 [Reticulomyxa filosa]|eukprot:ETO35813.1 hypothetical protein RFI_01247 [Reticulomyxa filosa]
MEITLPSSHLFRNDYPSIYYLMSINFTTNSLCGAYGSDDNGNGSGNSNGEEESIMTFNFQYDISQTLMFWFSVLLFSITCVYTIYNFPCVPCIFIKEFASKQYDAYRFRTSIQKFYRKKEWLQNMRYDALTRKFGEKGVVEIVLGYLDDLDSAENCQISFPLFCFHNTESICEGEWNLSLPCAFVHQVKVKPFQNIFYSNFAKQLARYWTFRNRKTKS